MKEIKITLNEDNKATIVVGDNTTTGYIFKKEIEGDKDKQLEDIMFYLSVFY